MFSKEELELLKVIKENNFVSKKVFKNAKIGKAYLECLKLYNWDDEFFKDNLEEFAKYAEEDLVEYVFNFATDSFQSPYIEIVQEFYQFSNSEIANLARKWLEAQLI